MNPQIEQSLNRIAASAEGRMRAIVDGARQGSKRAASGIEKGKKPLKTLSGLGLKLSAVSHQTTDRVLKQQTQLAANQLDAIARRFESAAKATCLRDLVKKQIQLTPEQFASLSRDTRASLGILVDAGADARDILGGTFNELKKAGKSRTAAASKTAKKTAKKAKAKVARKASSAKTAGKKTVRKAARKTAAKAEQVAAAAS
jgi:hypothetical protein